MTDDRRNESREPAKPTLAPRDLAEGRWRGVFYYMSQDFKRRYGPDACTPPPPGTPRRKQSPPTA